MKKYLNVLVAISVFIFVTPSYADTWYESKVVEVTSRAQSFEGLYIRTELNPKPSQCSSNWAGARWAESGVSLNLAASIALAAQMSGKIVRFSISDEECDPSGLPIMTYIQIR